MTEPIRIGATFQTRYEFYNPITPIITDPAIANPASPINLTGITITYNVVNGGILRTFGVGTGVTVTPLTGIVVVELEVAQTILFTKDRNSHDYLLFSYADGNKLTKAIQARGVINIQDQR